MTSSWTVTLSWWRGTAPTFPFIIIAISTTASIVIRAVTATPASMARISISTTVSITIIPVQASTATSSSVIVPVSRTILPIPPPWTLDPRNRFQDSPFMNSLCIRTVFRKLDSYLSTIHHPPIKSIHSFLRLVVILVSDKGKPTRLASSSVSWDMYVHNLAILIKQWKQIIRGSSKRNVEDEERVGVGNVWRT
uniref:Uncharacterized protein n=1 Tax=Opuntia streptacantha TaxID=393608 RepID=A0A7C9A3C0_OPUST